MDWIDKKPLKKRKSPSTVQRPKTKKGKSRSSLSNEVEIDSLTAWLREHVQPPDREAWSRLTHLPSNSAVASEQALIHLQRLQWGLASIHAGAEVREFCERIVKLTEPITPGGPSEPDAAVLSSCEESIRKWLKNSDQSVLSDAWSLQAIALASGLPWIAKYLKASLVVRLLEALGEYYDRAMQVEDFSKHPLGALLGSCELPLLLGRWLDDEGILGKVVGAAAERFQLMLETTAEEPSYWLLKGGRRLRAFAAAALRINQLTEQLCLAPWTTPQHRAVAQIGVWLAYWTRRDGSPAFHYGDHGEEPRQFWRELFVASNQDKKLGAVLKQRLFDPNPKKSSDKAKKISDKDGARRLDRIPASFYSERGEAAAMQKNWTSHGSRILIDFSVDPMHLEVIGHKGEVLFAGRWTCDLYQGEHQLDVTSSWQEVSWFSDEDCDYLELEADFGTKCKAQRQILLIKKQGLVYLADAILGESKTNWKLVSKLHAGPKVSWHPAEQTRESFIKINDETTAVCLPLASGEWRRQPSAQTLQWSQNELEVSFQAKAARLYSPILLAIKKEVAEQPFTWRQLTIVENLELQSPDVAAAYRVQFGGKQWLFYRSLAPATPRTLVGVHTNADFFVVEFDPNTGDTDSLVEVSPAD